MIHTAFHGRRRAILRVLQGRRGEPRVALPRLQRELGVSRSTLRRDLLELEHLGEVVRVRGGVMHADFVRGEPSFERRRAANIAEKKAIAQRAAACVPENATVYLDAGSTCLELGRLLMARADLRIYTHSIRLLADANSAGAQASLVCVGGEYRPVSEAVVGGLTASWMVHLSFDYGFVAASGVEPGGCSTTEMSEMTVKQSVIRNSRTVALVADSSKWDTPAAVRFDDWSCIDLWVCDGGLPPSAASRLRECGTQVILAQ
jgi:DeoR/GlpR family transcriptional regulator of sugar metabolism